MSRVASLRYAVIAATLLVGAGGAGGARVAAQEAAVLSNQTLAELGDDDPRIRLRAAEQLKQTPYDEAAVPLARAIVDSDDAVQMEAIGAELNVFLAEKVVPRRRVGFVVEVRGRISAQAIFQQGSVALDPRPVPTEVLTALGQASHDEHPRVATEALYAFGALADNAYADKRAAMLSSAAADLTAPLGAADTEVRATALHVIARVYAWRPGDPGMSQGLGDAVVTMLNDRSFEVRTAAMAALGALRYDRGVQALTDIYQHYQRGATAGAALGALARIAHPASEALFVAALSSGDASIRTAAIEGLARIGAVAEAATIAGAMASERSEDVRLAGQFANVLLSEGPVDELVEGLTHPRTRSRSLQYLAEAIAGRPSVLRVHMPDPDPAVRADLLEAVGLSGDPMAISLAEPLRADADPAVARAAQRAIARLGAGRAAQP